MTSDMGSDGKQWHGVYMDVLEDLRSIINERALPVYKAHRKIEIETTFEGRAALNNLVDVLAHIATLLMKADSMSHREQVAQIVNIEDHLRRAVMEGQEEVVNDLLDEVAKRWDEYMEIAGPLRAEGALTSAPSHRQLEQYRSEIQDLLDTGRGLKPDAGWNEHLSGAGYFKEAAEVAQKLLDALNQCIGAANELLEQRRQAKKADHLAYIGIAVGIFGVVVGVLIAVLA
jgi:ribosomal protein L17